MSLDLATRQRKQAAQRALREIRAAEKSERPIQKRAKREPRVQHVNVKARQRDLAFLSWLHSVPCVACAVEGVPTFAGAWAHPANARVLLKIEAAHQKHIDGKGGLLGKRPDDAGHTCPLCAWHHRLAPNACDPAQRKFWARLNVNVGAFCKALHQAFRNGESGAEVVRRFAAYQAEGASNG